MRSLSIEQDLPASADICATLREGLPAYGVRPGWGVVDWVLVRESFFVGARAKVNEKHRRIEIRPTYGSRWAALVGLGLLGIFDAVNFRRKRRLMDEVQHCLEQRYSRQTGT